MDEPPRPAPRSRGIYLLPNLLTTGGMFAGFYAILAAAIGHFETACIAVFVAAMFDGIDGRIARLTGTSTEFGVQYDSLADLVSFGMAPALVMYHWALSTLKLDSVTLGKAGWSASFLYAACAALRLARFNSQVGVVDKRWFIGLASPAAAAVVVSFVWTMDHLGYSGEQMRFAALGVTVAAGLLMVSRLRYTSFKGGRTNPSPPGERVPFMLLLVVVLMIVAINIYPSVLLLAISWLYALSGPAMWLWNKIRRKSPSTPAQTP
ncbi:MAG: CDP-diacylglycerol--serine O-phosphatidyltransferase [Proteobacteria bacterium]|nr:CDP-diacylglycerol--serine O-phosphatidyltransferase [Pseudomonadota bacterium]